MQHNRSNIASSFMWRFVERSGAQLVGFIVSIILARMLAPEVYGTVALVTVLITFLQVFVDSGLGSALVQKKDADELDFSTIFYFNLGVSAIFYVLLFLVAPYIAAFYANEELSSIIRVLSLMIIVAGARNVQQAYVVKNMLFKRFFYASSFGTISAAIVGLAMAYGGYGIWALVAQQLTSTGISTFALWMIVKWRPQPVFSWSRLKDLFSFGWNLMVSALLNTSYEELRQLIIGKRYSVVDLAFYNRGQHFPKFITDNINVTIDSVLLPTMSEAQDDKEVVKAMTRRAIKTSVYLIAPLLIGLAAMADTFVKILLTDVWLESVPFIRLFCISYLLFPIQTANLSALKAIGRSDMFLKLEVIKVTIGVIILLSTMHLGVLAVALGMLASSLINQIVSAWPNKKLLAYGFIAQLKDILPTIILAVGMGGVVLLMNLLAGVIPTFALFILQIMAGAIFYLLGSILFKFESFYYIVNALRGFQKQRK